MEVKRNNKQPENCPRMVLVESKISEHLSEYDDYPFMLSEKEKERLVWCEGFNQYILPQDDGIEEKYSWEQW